jgi:hypothetical protein
MQQPLNKDNIPTSRDIFNLCPGNGKGYVIILTRSWLGHLETSNLFTNSAPNLNQTMGDRCEIWPGVFPSESA